MNIDRENEARLKQGEIILIGRHLYALCRRCYRVVRVDRPLLGALHICD